ncbi:hypothetical protein WN943_020411 [Citrus x changshan-huyou]
MIENDAPEASYFVTVYASDSAGKEVGFGQTFGARKSSNLFEIHAISERHLSLEISSMCFSFFPAVSLFGFYFVERSKRKGSQGIERRVSASRFLHQENFEGPTRTMAFKKVQNCICNVQNLKPVQLRDKKDSSHLLLTAE